MKKLVPLFGILLACFSFVVHSSALTLSSLSGQSINAISDPRMLQSLQEKSTKNASKRQGQSIKQERGSRMDPATEKENADGEGENLFFQEEKKPPFYSRTYPEDLPLFGQDLFDKPHRGPISELTTTVPGDYVLGPGDEFLVLFTGKEFREVSLVIDGEGMVTIPDMGTMPAAGLRFNEFKSMLASRTRQKMIGYELSHVALSALRTIRVFLLGNVKTPGTHHIPALTSLMQLLLETGGILPVGSLRTVQVKRSGAAEKTIDLYNVLLEGRNDGEFRLQDGDTIFVPTIGDTIALTGTVKKPAVYEIARENTIERVAQLAGGLLPNAQLIKIERIDKGKNRIVIDLDLQHEASLKTPIQSGDIIHVLPASDARRQTVRLSGYVERGGVFQWRKGMKLTDIITGPEMLLPQTDLSHLLVIRTNARNRKIEPISVNLERAFAERSSADNPTLQPNDEIQLFSTGGDHSKNVQTVVEKLRHQGRYKDIDKLVTVTGNIRYPGEYPYVRNMDLQQLLAAAGDIRANTDMDYCLIIRSDQLGRIHPFSVRLSEVFGLEGKKRSVSLNPKDQVLVFSLDERIRGKKTDKANTADKPPENDKDKGIANQFTGTSRENLNAGLGKKADGTVDPFSLEALKAVTNPAKTDAQPPQDGETGSEKGQRDGKPSEKDIALENEEMENVLVGFLLEHGTSETIEGGTRDAYLNQLVDPVLHENQARLLQLLRKKRELRQLVREELQPNKDQPVLGRQSLLQPVLEKLQEQATRDTPAQIIQIGGAIRYAGKYPLEPGMRISNLLLAGGGLSEPAYHLEAEISHFEIDEHHSTRMHHSTIDLFKITQGDPSSDQLLKPYDIVIIKQNPKWADISSVALEGNVRFPGVYPIQPGEKLTQVLERAGGLTDLAYPEAAVFTRKKLMEKEKRENENLVARMETHLIQTQYNKQAESAQDAGKPSANSIMVQELISKLKNTKPVGRLAINLKEILDNPGGPYDLMLQDGDHLVIPQRSDEVTVMGEVYFPTSHQFITSNDLESYIQASGGYTGNADDDRVYVVRADGRVTSKKQATGFPGTGWFTSRNAITIGPGDTVVVPMDVEKVAPMVLWKDITQIFYNLAVTTTALKTAGAF
ncbi:MAG: SLBB domain-containing protein [Magnetococcales bacterium]|nr:SLBB domain-containing protein [Magnetococcales bacterium]